MRITIHGAAGGVTGSAYLFENEAVRLLVDFGLFQGSSKTESGNVVPPGIRPKEIQAVLLTHAHLDHCGRLPLLVRAGFTGPIYLTAATAEMASLILHDSAHVQAADQKRENRKRQRAGLPPQPPLYDDADVDRTTALFRPVEFDSAFMVGHGVEARFIEAGHMLGSASIILRIKDGRRVVFSGDLGPKGLPIIRDRVEPGQANLVFLESTYGDRDHRSLRNTLKEFHAIVEEAVEKKHRLLVPVFAVGRSQQILYHLQDLFDQKIVPPFPVFLDSPMAIEATEITMRHPELFDREARHLGEAGGLLNHPDWLQVCPKAEDSMRLNDQKGPCAILAGAGMCTGGRILHHLKHGLWRDDTAVLFVGFQTDGSLGRRLVDGAETVRVLGEEIRVRAARHTLNGFSAHAGQTELLEWLEPLAEGRPQVVLTHGEERAREALAGAISRRFQLEALLPKEGDGLGWGGFHHR
jgi:metallo-beta-lactamase family protein